METMVTPDDLKLTDGLYPPRLQSTCVLEKGVGRLRGVKLLLSPIPIHLRVVRVLGEVLQ